MTDDLIKQLHNVRLEGLQELCWEAAYRIEELKESNKELTLQLLATSGQAADALDKLAKAVEALRFIGQFNTVSNISTIWKVTDRARAVLAELEKTK